MQGYVHSYESLAAVDGEGLRYAVFLSGCPLRCVYCHNPDTWRFGEGRTVSPQELADKIARYKPYFGTDGGATFSGGEPLCQAEFINHTGRLLRNYDIGYTIDTSGGVELTAEVKKALENADNVILDIKFWDDASYRRYTGQSMANTMAILDYLHSIGARFWLRTVVIPGINDSTDIMDRYLEAISRCKPDKYELLPFHRMGFFKYDNLGILNPLSRVEAMPPSGCRELQTYVDNRLKEF